MPRCAMQEPLESFGGPATAAFSPTTGVRRRHSGLEERAVERRKARIYGEEEEGRLSNLIQIRGQIIPTSRWKNCGPFSPALSNAAAHIAKRKCDVTAAATVEQPKPSNHGVNRT